MKIKVFRAGGYCGPSVNDPVVKTTKAKEEVDVSPSVANYLVEHGNAELIVETKAPEKSEEELAAEALAAEEKAEAAKTKKAEARKAKADKVKADKDKDKAETK